MRLSTIVTKLNAKIKQHGDLEVYSFKVCDEYSCDSSVALDNGQKITLSKWIKKLKSKDTQNVSNIRGKTKGRNPSKVRW